jgi:hypothetical protein
MCEMEVHCVGVVVLLVVFQARFVCSVSTRFLLYKVHAICFLHLATILDLLRSFDSAFHVVFIYTRTFWIHKEL